jgi:hypothetical protein
MFVRGNGRLNPGFFIPLTIIPLTLVRRKGWGIGGTVQSPKASDMN